MNTNRELRTEAYDKGALDTFLTSLRCVKTTRSPQIIIPKNNNLVDHQEVRRSSDSMKRSGIELYREPDSIT